MGTPPSPIDGIDGFNARETSNPTVYDPHEIHPPTLIEVESTNVVVRRRQPESRSVGPAGITSKSIHQRTADASAFDQRLKRDDLDAVCSLRKGRQSCPLTVVLGDEARKLSSIDHFSQTSNLRRAPAVAQHRELPLLVSADEIANQGHTPTIAHKPPLPERRLWTTRTFLPRPLDNTRPVTRWRGDDSRRSRGPYVTRDNPARRGTGSRSANRFKRGVRRSAGQEGRSVRLLGRPACWGPVAAMPMPWSRGLRLARSARRVPRCR